MGLDELTARLERDADARVATAKARAKAEVEAIVAAAVAASSRAREEVLARHRAERRARLDREIGEAKHGALAARLRAEHAFLGRVMVRADERLDAVDRDPAYRSALPERLTEALRFVGEQGAEVRCRPALASVMRGVVAGRDDVTVVEVPGMPAGFSVAARDGSVEVDDTLPARLERLRSRLLIELLAEVDR